MESQVTLVLCGNLSYQSLEGQLTNEQLSRLLELSDFSQGHRARSEPVGLLDAFVSDIGSLPGGLVCQLLAWSLGAGILAGGLLGASHLGLCFEFAEKLNYNTNTIKPFKASNTLT